jgi:isoaspartyl peptidase/L-asparaginase-like protein (Ntn-hydrolase superfamily)
MPAVLGGLIAVDAAGRLALPFNTAGMSRAWQTADSQEQVAVW